MNAENLIPNSERTPSERQANTRKGGVASGEARREKAKMSAIYAAFLAETFNIQIDDELKSTTGAKLVNNVIKRILVTGGPGAVSLMKKIREGTEGGKMALTGLNGGPVEMSILSPEQRDARISDLIARANEYDRR